MKMEFAPRGVIEFDGAKICSKNFSGARTDYNEQGKRNFSMWFTDPEIIDALINDTNEYGVGFNVRVCPPKEPGDVETGYLKVNVRFHEEGSNKGPRILVISGRNRYLVTEANASMLDDIDIDHIKMSISPYDSIGRDGKPHRTAWLQSMIVTQAMDNIGREIEDLMDEGEVDALPFED